ncbi:hypothetical protein [Variovorax ginsengisoli]|uniref:Uncharacterized protein n=1 Tax=Variovorax ginsengisoli TaxID=363844 RepID=A0ABT8SBN5_9BURK|nr:hypothetical protein [Variovorax ginsengisoli]MDN8616529.1 hypothetical protein [Variovorax ginsengisoli]MDO1535699.1 hypothetical protein [Variovorax ginsengisoli]
MRAPSIHDAPVSKTHRIADVTESAGDRATRSAPMSPMRPTTLWSAQELDAYQGQKAPQSPAPQSARGFTIKAAINQGSVDFRVSGKSTAVTFEELAAACHEQLPGVVLERRTKWLQYTFDLWSHAGQCLYSIPILSIAEPQPSAPLVRKPRRHPSELAPHHPRG